MNPFFRRLVYPLAAMLAGWTAPGLAWAGSGSGPKPQGLAVAPSIVGQPSDQTVVAGTSPSISVIAQGSPPLLYQWWFNGVQQPGATNATFTLTNAQPVNSGRYYVVVENAGGIAVSGKATLAVNVPPLITLQPTS